MTDQTLEKKNKKHRKEKPWDTDDINKWEIPSFLPEHSNGPFLEQSTFSTLFPKYRESYLSQIFPQLISELAKVHIKAELNLIEGSMTVTTTRQTYDPYIILKARDIIKLLARSVPLNQALHVLEDGVAAEVVKIGGMVRNKERFIKRRQRLIGNNGNTLKALELLTGCYVLVQGNTVSIVGDYKGIKQVRKVVVECMMNNVHPVYCVKELMIKRELAKDPALKDASWERFLPKFKKNLKTKDEKEEASTKEKPEAEKKKVSKKEKKEYTPFPPPQKPRKVDLLLESGEYFLSQEQKQNRELEKKREKQKETKEKKDKEKEKSFVAPKEVQKAKAKKEEKSVKDIVADLKNTKKKEEKKRSINESDHVIKKKQKN